MAASITLRKFVCSEYFYRNEHGRDLIAWPLRIEATAIDMPEEIFVYHSVDESHPIPGDQFSCVASVTQLSELPLSPLHVDGDNAVVPFYRRSVMEVFCETAMDVERVWTAIRDRVDELVRTWNAKERLYNTHEAIITDTGTAQQVPMIQPVNLSLSFRPAGSVILVDGHPHIDVPNPDASGWLPIAEYESAAPANATYFYNVAQHPVVKETLNSIGEGDIRSSLMLFNNGIRATYGDGWESDRETIFWKYPSVGMGQTPWPADYVDLENPGTTGSGILLTVFPAV
jgi:hypothetical protein